MSEPLDFMLHDYGTIIAIQPCSRAAVDWTVEHVSIEAWQWQSGAFVVEPRCVPALIAGIREEGLTI